MQDTFSPRDLARAIGVGESSLKRWADEGKLAVVRTAGGHRRISRAEAVRFIRESKLPLVKPELLGLVTAAAGHHDPAAEEELLFTLLKSGDARRARGLLLAGYLAGRSVAALADGPIRGAMARIGSLFGHDAAAVFVEHRATDAALQAVEYVRSFQPPVPPRAPVAVGGAPGGDPYVLPSLLASMVLSEAGFAAVNLGPDTPLPALELAAVTLRARLVWLACSSPAPVAALGEDLPAMARRLRRAALVLGGRGVSPTFHASPHAHVASSMLELAAFARGLSQSAT